MSISTQQVFLVPGHRTELVAGSGVRLAAKVEYCVVIANSAQEAQALLEGGMPEFVPVGFTSLADFETAVVKVRRALGGEDSDWLLVADPAVSSQGLDASQVFLVPGQRKVPVDSNMVRLAPMIEHCVVIAKDGRSARRLLTQTVKDFEALEFTSLAAFEDAVRKLRAALNGTNIEWPLVVAPGMD